MMYMLPDGWRDESTEGPYTEVLQTKGEYTVVRCYGETLFTLRHTNGSRKIFRTIEAAKAYAVGTQANRPINQPRD